MLLIYTSKLTPRINYTFRQVCSNILGLEIKFTSKIEEFIAQEGMKLSYGKQKLGNEFFIQQSGLLFEQGLTETEVRVSTWDDTFCFFRATEQSDLPFDIFAASFYLLSRYEEYLPHVKDEEGRYPASESLAYKNKFIEQPVVDIWAYKFKKVLQERFPEVNFIERKSQNKNLMVVSEAYKYRKKGIVRAIGASLRDFLTFNFGDTIERFRVLLLLKNDPYDIYDELIAFSKKESISWQFMFQLSNYSIKNKNIGYNKTKYHALIKSMGDYGEIGLLPGYEALTDFKTLRLEKKRWEAIVNRPLKINCTDFYDLNLPEFYNNLDKLEIAEDYSMGYVNQIGFRAGTCTPFLFYDTNLERISPLVLHPYVFNSHVIDEFSYFELKKKLQKIKKEVEAVEGNLTLLFQNSKFPSEQKIKRYFDLIYMLNKD